MFIIFKNSVVLTQELCIQQRTLVKIWRCRRKRWLYRRRTFYGKWRNGLGTKPENRCLHDMGKVTTSRMRLSWAASGERRCLHLSSRKEYESETRDTKLGLKKLPRNSKRRGKMPYAIWMKWVLSVSGGRQRERHLVRKSNRRWKKTFLLKSASCFAIFMETSREIRDRVSLRVPHGADSVVRDVKIFYPCKWW